MEGYQERFKELDLMAGHISTLGVDIKNSTHALLWNQRNQAVDDERTQMEIYLRRILLLKREIQKLEEEFNQILILSN